MDAFYRLFVEGNWQYAKVEGDRELLERLLAAAGAPAPGSSVLV